MTAGTCCVGLAAPGLPEYAEVRFKLAPGLYRIGLEDFGSASVGITVFEPATNRTFIGYQSSDTILGSCVGTGRDFSNCVFSVTSCSDVWVDILQPDATGLTHPAPFVLSKLFVFSL
jgi:hypothetical protein